MKYKIGDKVKIRSLEWYNANKDENGLVSKDSEPFVFGMIKYCGKEAIIEGIEYDDYLLDIDNNNWFWEDYMFEEV